jgi:hypothetical protein
MNVKVQGRVWLASVGCWSPNPAQPGRQPKPNLVASKTTLGPVHIHLSNIDASGADTQRKVISILSTIRRLGQAREKTWESA